MPKERVCPGCRREVLPTDGEHSCGVLVCSRSCGSESIELLIRAVAAWCSCGAVMVGEQAVESPPIAAGQRGVDSDGRL